MNWGLFWTIALAITIGPWLVNVILTLVLGTLLSRTFWKIIGLLILCGFAIWILPSLTSTDVIAIVIAIVLGYTLHHFNKWGSLNTHNLQLHNLILSKIIPMMIFLFIAIAFLLLALSVSPTDVAPGAYWIDGFVVLLFATFFTGLLRQFIKEYKKLAK